MGRHKIIPVLEWGVGISKKLNYRRNLATRGREGILLGQLQVEIIHPNNSFILLG